MLSKSKKSEKPGTSLINKVLTRQKPLVMFHLEHKIAEQASRIKLLEEELEAALRHNLRLISHAQIGIPICVQSEEDSSPPQFRISL